MPATTNPNKPAGRWQSKRKAEAAVARLAAVALENRRARELAAYLCVSILAIAPDLAVFTLLITTGLVAASAAGAISYLVAMCVHYLLAVRLVFSPEHTGKSQLRLAGEYVISGIVGVTLTAAVIHLLTTNFGLSPYIAKAAGIIASFLAVYLVRSLLIFRTHATDQKTATSDTGRFKIDSESVRREIADQVGLAACVSGRSIAVLLPCYNEEATVGETVASFRQTLPGAKIYVYDNNSTDRTSEVAQAAGAIGRYEPFRGKGNVVRRMLADIDADIYVLADGDMTYDSNAAGWMVQQLVSRNLDMVVGTRVAEMNTAFRAGHKFGNHLFNVVVQWLFGPQFTDILSGYRVLSRRFAKSFPAASSGFEIETELSVHALDLRLATLEAPLSYRERPANSASKLRTFTDGFRILRTILSMYRWLKPKQFYGSIGCGFAVVSLLLGLPVVVEFMQTGLVPRIPTALLAASIGQLAMLSLACGVILESISRGQRELRRMRYLDLPAPAEFSGQASGRTVSEIRSPRPDAPTTEILTHSA